MGHSSDLARQYSRDNSPRFRQELNGLLSIPSISTDPAFAGDVRRAAEWLADHLRGLDVANVQILPTAGHPVVFGEWLGAGPDKPTVLVYGHYDVVPAALEDGWETPPFEPVEKDGLIYARGVADDKGQLFIHMKAFEAYMATGGSPVNVKFFLEGEEEIGSVHLSDFLKEHLELLKADVCVISDSSMRVMEEPVVLHSLRGMTYMEINVQGPSDDQHSGAWGGAIHNPALALVEILSKLHNPDHSIAVPGFYDEVVSLTPEERRELAKTDLTEAQAVESTGAAATWGESAYSLRERVTSRPTMEINGLLSGWTGAGPKTIVPSKAMAKLSCRLVGNQNPETIYKQVKEFIESVTPPTVKIDVSLISTSGPALISFTIPEMQAASRAYEKGWGATPTFTRGGGSIPVVADIFNLMHIPVVMMGYCFDDDGFHGANEHFGVENFDRGIETSIVYLEELAALPR